VMADNGCYIFERCLPGDGLADSCKQFLDHMKPP
jgi:hypothetical protein